MRVTIDRKELHEWWEEFVVEHYMAEEGKSRLNQDDLMDALHVSFINRFGEYR